MCEYFAVKFSDFVVELLHRFRDVLIVDRRIILPYDDLEWMTQTTFRYNIEAYRFHFTTCPEYYVNFNACIDCDDIMDPQNTSPLCCETFCPNKN
jgi:hypothetical protein